MGKKGIFIFPFFTLLSSLFYLLPFKEQSVEVVNEDLFLLGSSFYRGVDSELHLEYQLRKPLPLRAVDGFLEQILEELSHSFSSYQIHLEVFIVEDQGDHYRKDSEVALISYRPERKEMYRYDPKKRCLYRL